MGLILYPVKTEEGLGVRARAEGEGGTIGDFFRIVEPGEELFGIPYDDLLRAATEGDGTIEVPDDDGEENA